MATFTQRSNGWFAQVRRKGHKSISRTFNTKAEAERWALQIEASMGVGTYTDNREALSTTLADCLSRYASEILPHKKGADRDMYRVNLWRNDPLSMRGIGTIKQVDVAKWRDARIASGISGSTVTKDLALLSHVFTIAIKEWGFPLSNPVLMIRKPKQNKPRDRRLLAGEEQAIFEHCTDELKAFLILAIETAMRRSEIVGLKRSDIKGRVAFLPDTKNDESRAVPLSKRAIEVINSLPARLDGKLFQYEADAYTKGFLRARKAAGLENIRLHDLRHEALSSMAEKGFSVIELQAIGGHKTAQMLSRYVNLRAEDLADKLG